MRQAICSDCGSENVSLHCKWDVKEQAWLPVEPPPCDHCGKEIEMEYIQ